MTGNYGTLVAAVSQFRSSGENRNVSISHNSCGLIKEATRRYKGKIPRRNVANVFKKEIVEKKKEPEESESSSLVHFESATGQEIKELLATLVTNPPDLGSTCLNISRKLDTLLVSKNHLEEELRMANTETAQLGENWTKAAEVNEKLERENHYLREKIRFLEGNINMSDTQLAYVIYGGDLSWSQFPDTARRGVLKVYQRGKWKKRHVILLDNFLFMYRPVSQDSPQIIVRLDNVSINTDHRKDSSFTVVSSGKSFRFCAATHPIMTQWMKAMIFCKPWYEEVPDKPFIPTSKPKRVKVSNSRSQATSVIQKARDTLRKYSSAQGSLDTQF